MFSAAAGINFLIDFFVQRHIAPDWLIVPTHILEALLWSGDVLAFLLFTAIQLLTFGSEMALSAKKSFVATSLPTNADQHD